MDDDAYIRVVKAVEDKVWEEGAGDASIYTRIAWENKVLLEFLRVSRIDPALLQAEEEKRRLIEAAVNEITGILEGLDYAFYKLVKPIAYVPSDVDLLVRRSHIAKSVERLKRAGYRVEVEEPYTVTMVRGPVIVDLYTHPSLAGIVYLNGDRLLEYRGEAEFGGVRIPALEEGAEALAAAAHAVYKERIFTLNDYVTIKKWSDKRTLEAAWELKATSAVEVSMHIIRLAEKGALRLPYKIPLPLWLRVLAGKIAGDPETRGTFLNAPRALRDRRFGKLVTGKIFRTTY